MAVQRLYQICDGLRAAARGHRDDTLPVAYGDAGSCVSLVTVRHGTGIDPHQQTGLRGCREAELLGCLFEKTFLPAILGLYRDSLLAAPYSDAHAAASALCYPYRPLLQPSRQFDFLYTCCHSVPLLRPEFSREFSRWF